MMHKHFWLILFPESSNYSPTLDTNTANSNTHAAMILSANASNLTVLTAGARGQERDARLRGAAGGLGRNGAGRAGVLLHVVHVTTKKRNAAKVK